MLGTLLAVALALVVSCTTSSDDSEQGSSTTTTGAQPTTTTPGTAPVPTPGAPAVARAAPPGSGPRELPPTFVSLELDAFPGPAEARCAAGDEVPVPAGSSLADAVADAEAGTTLVVEPGTYSGASDDDAALRIEQDDVCVQAADGGTVVVEPSGSEQTTGLVLSGSRSTVEGVTLHGFEAGVILGREEGETQEDVTLEQLVVEDMTGEFRDGIVAETDNRSEPGAPPSVDGLLLAGVHVDGADLGISCNAGPCAHWWIEDSTVVGRRGAESSGADTFAIEEGRQIAVVDSTFENADADGIDTKADDVVVYGAQVRSMGRNGIKAWRGVDVITSVVDGTDADASLVGDHAGRYRYLGTLVAHHGEPGDSAYVATWSYDERESGLEIEIVNCIFFENTTGGFFAPEDADLTIEHTILDLAADDKLVDLGDETTFTAAQLDDFLAAGHGSDVVLADPGFTDAGDYSTSADSPARDAGLVVEGLDLDLRGDPRTTGAAPDIGPVESG